MAFGASWIDFKLGFRMLIKHPVLTLVAVFALAIGIPVGMIPLHIMSAWRAPLPFDEGERIVALRYWDLEASRPVYQLLHDFVEWREELTTLDRMGAARTDEYNVISDDGRAAPVRGAMVTASTFDIARVQPLIGRALIEGDEVIGAPAVVVIGNDVWQTRLGGDPDVVGRMIRVGGVPHTVVGVMPDGFGFPFSDHLWLPLRVNVLDHERGQGPWLWVFGRLSDGISIAEAQAELTTVGTRMMREFPDRYARLRAEVLPYTAMRVGDDRELYILQVLALLVLAIACGNVGTLILARTATRSGEIAVRTALGASRGRVVSQLFVESLWLSVLAAGAGLWLGDWIIGRWDGFVSGWLPFWVDLGVGPRTVFFALSLAVLSAVIAGVVPALKATGRDVHLSLQRSASGGSGIRFGAASTVLIAAEVALGMGCLTAGAALAPGLVYDVSEGKGIAAEQYLSAQLTIPWVDNTASVTPNLLSEFRAQVSATHQELARQLKAAPGVRGVALGSHLPGMDHPRRSVEIDGEAQARDHRGRGVHIARVDVDFFNALEQPIITGRGFDSRDLGDDKSSVIVNSSFVDRLLGGRNPIGRRVRYNQSGDEEPGPWYEIVGVVGHLGMHVLNPAEDAGLYHPVAPGRLNPVRLAIHVGDDPESFAPRLRAIGMEVDPTAMIRDVVALDAVFSEELFGWRWGAVFVGLLATVAMTLSASGLYALMSFTVAERAHEIGIRTALGARASNIVNAIAKRAIAQLCVGVLFGVAISTAMASQLANEPSVRATNWPVVIALIASVAVAIGLVALVLPTLRALRIGPMDALREG